MAFTYRSALTDDISKVRVSIGDVTEGTGIRPGGTNFSDAELTGLVSLYGSWQTAAVAACRAAAAQWSTRASSVSIGDYSESRQAADKLIALADTLEVKLAGSWSGLGLGASTVANPAVIE